MVRRRKGTVMERLTIKTEDGCERVSIRTKNQQLIDKLAYYEDLEEQGRLVILSCKVGDTVYVDNTILPIEDMECYEDIDNKIPLYFRHELFHSALQKETG